MRTTFTPDPDVAAKLKALARQSNSSMSRVVNDLLRLALAGQAPLDPAARFVVKPFPMGLQPGIDPLKLNQLVDQLEDEDRLIDQ